MLPSGTFLGVNATLIEPSLRHRRSVRSPTLTTARRASPAVVQRSLTRQHSDGSKAVDINWGGSRWGIDGVLAFVAGFSEPFFSASWAGSQRSARLSRPVGVAPGRQARHSDG